MRKAASLGLYLVFFAFSILFVFFVSFSFVSAYSIDSDMPVSSDQDTGDAITGFITVSDTVAIGHVTNSGGDTVEIGLASYLKVDRDIENQVFHDWARIVLGPYESAMLRVSIPCWSQIDLFRIFPERPGPHGSVIYSFRDNVRYGQRLISAVHTVNVCGRENPNETPSSTSVASATPVATPTSSVSDSEILRTDLSDHRSDNFGCSVRDCSGNVVGGSGGVVLGVSTDTPRLPLTGVSSLRNLFGYFFMFFTVGILMRKLADHMEF